MPSTTLLTQFAEAETGAQSGGIFGALGIDWQMLLFQVIGFVILVWLMGKFVYPILMKQVDQRQKTIDDSLKAAHEAEKKAASAEESIDKQLATAKREARDIVATAKDEASAMLDAANKKAKSQAEHLVASAREDIDKEVLAARKTLYNDTVELVAQATGKVIDATYSASLDNKLIDTSIKSSKESK